MNVEFSATAMKFINRLDKRQRQRIADAVEKIPDGDIKHLKGELNRFYRLRVGKMRILYEIENDTIVVDRVDYRGDVYK